MLYVIALRMVSRDDDVKIQMRQTKPHCVAAAVYKPSRLLIHTNTDVHDAAPHESILTCNWSNI